MADTREGCAGPLVWFNIDHAHGGGAILECAACRYVVMTGNFHDRRHARTDIIRGS